MSQFWRSQSPTSSTAAEGLTELLNVPTNQLSALHGAVDPSHADAKPDAVDHEPDLPHDRRVEARESHRDGVKQDRKQDQDDVDNGSLLSQHCDVDVLCLQDMLSTRDDHGGQGVHQ